MMCQFHSTPTSHLDEIPLYRRKGNNFLQKQNKKRRNNRESDKKEMSSMGVIWGRFKSLDIILSWRLTVDTFRG